MDSGTLPFSPVTAKVSLDSTLGAAFLGHVVTTLLYGITSLQAFVYYRHNKTDGAKLKFSVFIIWILDSVHAGLITGAIYWYCITNFTNLFAVQRPIWPIPTMIIISNVSNSIVRCIFGYRLWKLSNHNRIFPAVIAFLSIFIFVDAAYFAAKLYSIPLYSEIIHFSWSLYLGLSVEATVDLIVAVTQCLLLRRLETGIQSFPRSRGALGLRHPRRKAPCAANAPRDAFARAFWPDRDPRSGYQSELAAPTVLGAPVRVGAHD
ncbi:hypothetical protein NUW54_g9133 [Trametes sanguinea]|uniref:Uncharacterized protein n=1 Tax=Trametes sanguinea TaxID=158606 RepID=A0ACC1P898_9APHY|nr:hypothetical protein NUW54_g9133 [Trametes sanguinea]